MLEFAQRHVASFDAACKAMVQDMCACAWCGRPACGGPHCFLRDGMRKVHSTTTPRGILANPSLTHLALHPDGASHYWMCGSCNHKAGGPKRLQKQKEWLQAPVVPDMKPEHQLQLDEWRQLMGMLLSLPPGSALQTGVLQCGVRFAQNVLGYCHGLAPGADPDLLSGPMVRWDDDMVSVLSWPALPFPH
jgi:hypothetical protein